MRVLVESSLKLEALIRVVGARLPDAPAKRRDLLGLSWLFVRGGDKAQNSRYRLQSNERVASGNRCLLRYSILPHLIDYCVKVTAPCCEAATSNLTLSHTDLVLTLVLPAIPYG